MSALASMFKGPPKPPPNPVLKPVQNTALTAQVQAMQRRRGAGGTVFTTGSGQMNRGTSVTHSLTGQ